MLYYGQKMQDFMHMKIASEAASEALLTDFSAFREVALFIISIYRRAGTYPHVFNCESPFVIKKASACSPYGADERTRTFTP